MFNTPRHLSEINSAVTAAAKKITETHLQFVNAALQSAHQVSNACLDAWAACCKASETTAQEVSKSAAK